MLDVPSAVISATITPIVTTATCPNLDLNRFPGVNAISTLRSPMYAPTITPIVGIIVPALRISTEFTVCAPPMRLEIARKLKGTSNRVLRRPPVPQCTLTLSGPVVLLACNFNRSRRVDAFTQRIVSRGVTEDCQLTVSPPHHAQAPLWTQSRPELRPH